MRETEEENENWNRMMTRSRSAIVKNTERKYKVQFSQITSLRNQYHIRQYEIVRRIVSLVFFPLVFWCAISMQWMRSDDGKNIIKLWIKWKKLKNRDEVKRNSLRFVFKVKKIVHKESFFAIGLSVFRFFVRFTLFQFFLSPFFALLQRQFLIYLVSELFELIHFDIAIVRRLNCKLSLGLFLMYFIQALSTFIVFSTEKKSRSSFSAQQTNRLKLHTAFVAKFIDSSIRRHQSDFSDSFSVFFLLSFSVPRSRHPNADRNGQTKRMWIVNVTQPFITKWESIHFISIWNVCFWLWQFLTSLAREKRKPLCSDFHRNVHAIGDGKKAMRKREIRKRNGINCTLSMKVNWSAVQLTGKLYNGKIYEDERQFGMRKGERN